MILEYEITYLACQSCDAKIHCEDCAGKVRDMLLHQDGVRGAEADMKGKMLRIDADGADEDELLDALELFGVLV